MKKANWEMIGALASIIALVVSVLEKDSLRPWIWTSVRVSAVIVFLLIIYHKRQSIANTVKFKPRLTITMRDITVYVYTERETRPVPGQQKPNVIEVMKGRIGCTVKITNKGRGSATNVQGQIALQLGKGSQAIVLEVSPAKSYDLANKQILPLLIRYRPFNLFQKGVELYPDSFYRLEYIYTCDERPKPRKSVVTGELSKADWIGDEEHLRTVREKGYHT
jgi:hypothetical protein